MSASPKKSSVKWNVPQYKHESLSQNDHDSYCEEQSIVTVPDYSDTFISNSYSNTFVDDLSNTQNGQTSDRSTTNISTVLPNRTFSEVPEATYLETAVTEESETFFEVEADYTLTDGTFKSRRYEKDTSLSESALPDSYTDTFESSIQTKTEFHPDSKIESSSSARTLSVSSTSSLRTYTEYSLEDKDLFDHSCLAPDLNRTLWTDDEDEDNSYSDDYSFTFEQTEASSYVHLDPEKAQLEAEEVNAGEEAKRDFIKKMMTKLKTQPRKKVVAMEAVSAKNDVEENDYLKHFCRKKKKILTSRIVQKQKELDKTEDKASEPAEERLSDYGLPHAVLERAKLVNIISAMKRAASETIHEPRKCEQCSEMKSYLDFEDAQRQFVNAHAKRLKNKMMDSKVEDHILKMNSISLIAELARDLPKASEKPEKILDQLLEPLLGKNVMR